MRHHLKKKTKTKKKKTHTHKKTQLPLLLLFIIIIIIIIVTTTTTTCTDFSLKTKQTHLPDWWQIDCVRGGGGREGWGWRGERGLSGCGDVGVRPDKRPHCETYELSLHYLHSVRILRVDTIFTKYTYAHDVTDTQPNKRPLWHLSNEGSDNLVHSDMGLWCLQTESLYDQEDFGEYMWLNPDA